MGSAKKKIVLPPLPVKRKTTRLAQAEVDIDLYDAVHAEMKLRNLKIRQVIEWCLKTYLLNVNPKAAEKLGIFPEDSNG